MIFETDTALAFNLSLLFSNARLVLSADDDTVVDISNVLQIYSSTTPRGLLECGKRLLKQGLVGCNVACMFFEISLNCVLF